MDFVIQSGMDIVPVEVKSSESQLLVEIPLKSRFFLQNFTLRNPPNRIFERISPLQILNFQHFGRLPKSLQSRKSSGLLGNATVTFKGSFKCYTLNIHYFFNLWPFFLFFCHFFIIWVKNMSFWQFSEFFFRGENVTFKRWFKCYMREPKIM